MKNKLKFRLDTEIDIGSILHMLYTQLSEKEAVKFVIDLDDCFGNWDFTSDVVEELLELCVERNSEVLDRLIERSYEKSEHPNLAKFLLLKELENDSE